MSGTQAVIEKQGRRRLLRPWRFFVHLWLLLFRSDVFISYTRSDRGRHYAHALASELRKREFEPLMDTFEARMSRETPEELLDQMRRCMQLVVVASPGAIVSAEVAREIELFPKRGRSIVLLEFEQDVRSAPWYASYLAGLPPVPAGETAARGFQRDSLREVECKEGLESRPAESTVDLIVDAFTYKRARFQRALIAGITAILFLAAAGALARVSYKYYEANHNFLDTQSRLGAEQQKLSEENDKTQKAVTDRQKAERLAKEADTKAKSSEAIAKRETEVATLATQQKEQAELEREKANAETAKAVQTQNDAIAETQKAVTVSGLAQKQERIALARLAAVNALESDVYLAYRLAEYVYDLDRREEHEQLLRRAASRARFPYQEFPDCGGVMSASSPWALLGCRGGFRVINLETGRTEGAFVGGEPRQSWIVRHNNSWRVLSVREQPFENSQLTTRVVYAWDPAVEPGRETPKELARFPPGPPAGVGVAELKDCGGAGLIWDYYAATWNFLPANGGLITLNRTRSDRFASCRPDGSFLIARQNGMEWFAADGTSQGVQAWADGENPSRLSSGVVTQWSPDGRFLALYDYAGSRLTVLNAEARRFTAMSPDKWLETAYTWSDKHTLISSGHTRDAADYRITSFDPQSLNRQQLRSYGRRIEKLRVLPDGRLAILDESGAIEVGPLEGGGDSWRGYHPYATELMRAGRFLLTQGVSGLRQWPLRPAAENWIFRSTGDSHYSVAVGEPTHTWLAANLQEMSGKTRKFIEVRRVTGGEPILIPMSDCQECDATVFSLDGRWLFAVSKREFLVFRTGDWQQHYKFATDPNDRRYFYYIRFDDGIVRFVNDVTDEVYEFDVRGEKPELKRPRLQNAWLGPSGCVWPTGLDGGSSLKGWEPLLIAGPADRTVVGCPQSEWLAYIVQRNEGWDYELIPRRLEMIRQIFDKTIPPRTPEELRKIAEASGGAKIGK